MRRRGGMMLSGITAVDAGQAHIHTVPYSHVCTAIITLTPQEENQHMLVP